MIHSFSFSNIFSFRDKQEISFIPESLKDEVEDNIFYSPDYSESETFLKSVCVYGHNSHGKTNILKAFEFFISFIKSSFTQPSLSIPIDQFSLNTENDNEASFFEIKFVLNNTKYKYGFEIKPSGILSEWLYYSDFGKKENHLFHRIDQEFRINKVWAKESKFNIEIQSIPFVNKKTVLLFSVLAAQEVIRIKDLSEFIESIILLKDLNNSDNLLSRATLIYANSEYNIEVQKFLKGADFGFNTIFDKIERKISEGSQYNIGFLQLLFKSEIQRFELYTLHNIFKGEQIIDTVEFEMLKKESDGTVKFFILACFLVYAKKNNLFILIDELDSRFHFELLEFLLSTYHKVDLIPSTSQLFFTSHNTVLLDRKFRRDQFIHVEKDNFAESHISRMHTKEQPIRIDASMEKEYRKGKIARVNKKSRIGQNQGKLFE